MIPAGKPRFDWAVITFFGIAYAIAWGIWLVMSALASEVGIDTIAFLDAIEAGDFAGLSTDVPDWLLYAMTRVQDFSFSIAGLVMISFTAGAAGWRTLGQRLIRWRIAPRWYLFAFLPVLFYLVAAAIVTVVEDGSVSVGASELRTILFSLEAGLIVSLLFRGAMGEELGLRGFALPRLQERMSPVKASLVIGLFWGLWHLPVLGNRDAASIVALLLLIFGLSFIFTWLFNGSGGSLIPVLLFHATQNWEEAFETVFPAIVGTDWELISALLTLVLSGIAVVAVKRSRNGVTSGLTENKEPVEPARNVS